MEYKDKMEEEWELFQKSMKEESHVSRFKSTKNVTCNLSVEEGQLQKYFREESCSGRTGLVSKVHRKGHMKGAIPKGN